MDEQQAPLVPRVRLGTQGLEVSKLGFGCMGLTGVFNLPLDDEAGIAVIKHAFRRGVTFFDTSDVYGPHTSEILLGKVSVRPPFPDSIHESSSLRGSTSELLTTRPWKPSTLLLLVGMCAAVHESGVYSVCGQPEYVRACCDASLRRLGVDSIDLYFQHRIDTTIPIEDTIGELKKLVEEGKVRYIGLLEPSPDTIRRAHAVHPITAVQMEWSVWARDIEPEIVPLCSPLGRGFFGGRGVTEQVSAESVLHWSCQNIHPRFAPENLEKNKQIYQRMEELANKHRCSPAQLALAWVLHQGDDVVPIPGTTKIKNLDTNINGALKVKLTDEDLKEIGSQIREEEVAGGRQYAFFAHTTWKYADTPKK
ncbi:hypothetical protein U9M48_004938 [Paspalum notatum var. saurae]|uniref:NADP-dependent oxidoreductase domain-containing protein n=1 Tax=Paspalum notatum var. saurae TaxID=547442 RepID=A0AAQ3PKS7_PASNO